MSKNPYIILGVPENATQAEITAAYDSLSVKYAADRFKEGEEGAHASRMLDEVRLAYAEAMERAKQASFIDEGHDIFFEVREAIKAGKLDDAQRALDNITERSAKWCYYQANIYYKRGWLVECKKQLENAIAIEPDNEKYKSDLEKLKREMNPSHVFGDGQTAHPTGRSYSQGDATGDACCDSLATCLCVNALCNCCWN